MKRYVLSIMAILVLLPLASIGKTTYRQKSTADLKKLKSDFLKRSNNTKLSKKERAQAAKEAQQISWILWDRE